MQPQPRPSGFGKKRAWKDLLVHQISRLAGINARLVPPCSDVPVPEVFQVFAAAPDHTKDACSMSFDPL
jgi:hypothetical protein